VVCGGGLPLGTQAATGNLVSAVLPRAGLNPRQLLVVVHAAAMGLQVSPALLGESPSKRPDGRTLDVLRFLAEGASTREIAARIGVSQMGISRMLTRILDRLRAKAATAIGASNVK
jgi:DNA-binding NarL/FixJ family response regulator